MTNAMKAVESVKSGMTVREALKKHKVPAGAYYKAKKGNTGVEQVGQPFAMSVAIAEEAAKGARCHETKKANIEKLTALYGVISPMTYARAVEEINESALYNS